MSHTNSVGVTYYLHSTQAKNGSTLYFFSKNSDGAIPKPEGYIVAENARTKLPYLKRG